MSQILQPCKHLNNNWLPDTYKAVKTLRCFENHKYWVSWNKYLSWDNWNNNMIYSICLKLYNIANISLRTGFLILIKLWKLLDVLKTINIESARINDVIISIDSIFAVIPTSTRFQSFKKPITWILSRS